MMLMPIQINMVENKVQAVSMWHPINGKWVLVTQIIGEQHEFYTDGIKVDIPSAQHGGNMKGFNKCPHCGYETYLHGQCGSCGYGITPNPILPKNSSAQQSAHPTASGVGKRGHLENLLVSLGKYLVKIGGG